MSGEFYENIFDEWVVSWFTREDLLGVYHEYHERGKHFFYRQRGCVIRLR